MYDMVKSFVTMIDVWRIQIENGEFHHFECLKSLSNISPQKVKNYCDILEKLITEFKDKRLVDFKNMENDFALYANPFTVSILKVKPILQLEVADLQNDTFLKSKCKNDLTGLDIFKKIDPVKFPCLTTFAIRICAMFGSTYICEQFFSKMNIIKSRKRSRLTDDNLRAQVRIATYSETPNFISLVL
ncbi:General transcription factor II-I repeat domain-containing protein 2 [Blattella germanica]|nr:General transcription factor II-I repeat domain-containing protein 2 [Blattella germanica]